MNQATITVTDALASAGEASAPVPVRVYRPHSARDAVLWAHGGGFVHGSLDMSESDWVARSLAELGHLVVAVDYRLATATVRYPAPSDDLLTAWSWLTNTAAELGVAGLPLHLGGASAGGNLALGAALRVRDGAPEAGGAPLPASLVLAYPTLHAVQEAPSAELSNRLATLPEESRWQPENVRSMYLRFVPGALEDAPAYAIPGIVGPAGLPPVIIVADETDGLRASAEQYVRALSAAGVEHAYTVEPGTRHGHLNRPDEPAAGVTIDRFDAWLRAHEGVRA